MCSPTKCTKCGKITWSGCGQHIEAVKAQVPAHQWCTCERDPNTKPILAGLFRKIRR